MKSKQAIELQDFARNPYAWPGGYPLFALCSDGGALCHDCVRDNYRQIREAQKSYSQCGWNVVAIDVNYEEGSVTCDHCGDAID